MSKTNDSDRSQAVPPLSCYIRTLNEERNIEAVVRAARRVAAEVVVVDSGSTDRTAALAEAAGARVVVNPWPGNGFQKQFGEAACTNDWVLDLDADEVVSPELAAEIGALFAQGEPPLGVYEIDLTCVPPVGEPWYDFDHAFRRKLYDRRRFSMPGHKVWDQLELPAGTRVGRLRATLMHYAFRDIAHVVAKLNGYSTMGARDGKRKTKGKLLFRIWCALPFYFFKHYVLRGLCRAGTYGFIIAASAAYGRWLRDAKMYEAIRIEERRAREAGR